LRTDGVVARTSATRQKRTQPATFARGKALSQEKAPRLAQVRLDGHADYFICEAISLAVLLDEMFPAGNLQRRQNLLRATRCEIDEELILRPPASDRQRFQNCANSRWRRFNTAVDTLADRPRHVIGCPLDPIRLCVFRPRDQINWHAAQLAQQPVLPLCSTPASILRVDACDLALQHIGSEHNPRHRVERRGRPDRPKCSKPHRR
jgi:hypothetical protein